jgi:hypothetical protein
MWAAALGRTAGVPPAAAGAAAARAVAPVPTATRAAALALDLARPDADVAEAAAGALAALISSDTCAVKAVGALAALAAAVRRPEAGVVRAAIGALAAAMKWRAFSSEALSASGAVASLVAAVARPEADVAEAAAAALGSDGGSQEYWTAVKLARGARVLAAALRRPEGAVAVAALRPISLLAQFCNSQIPPVAAAMAAAVMRQEAVVAIAAAKALGGLHGLRGPRALPPAVAKGVISSLLEALRRPEVADVSLRTLRTAAIGSGIRAALLSVGGVPALLEAAGLPELQSAAFKALRDMRVRPEAFKQLMAAALGDAGAAVAALTMAGRLIKLVNADEAAAVPGLLPALEAAARRSEPAVAVAALRALYVFPHRLGTPGLVLDISALAECTRRPEEDVAFWAVCALASWTRRLRPGNVSDAASPQLRAAAAALIDAAARPEA